MDWISAQLSSLYLWISQAPVFLQVAVGVFAALIAKSFLFLWLPSPYFAAIQSIRNNIPVLAYGFDSLEARLKEAIEQITAIEDHTEKLSVIDLTLDDIRSHLRDIERDRNGEEDLGLLSEERIKEKDDD